MFYNLKCKFFIDWYNTNGRYIQQINIINFYWLFYAKLPI